MKPRLFPAPEKTVNGERWGYIDQQGSFRIPPRFDYANDYQRNGLAIVEIGNKYGVINSKGRFVVEPKYETITQFTEGRAEVVDEEGFWVMDQKGNILTSKAYDFISMYQEGRAMFGESDKDSGDYLYGYLDKVGEVAVPAQYTSATDFKDGVAIVQDGKQYKMINRDGKVLHKYPYPYVGAFGERMLSFQEEEDGLYGYINEQGKVMIPPTYGYVQPFSEGRAVVNHIDDYIYKYGLIDKKGKEILKPVYADINRLGQKRIAVGKALNEEKPYLGSNYAIADTDGVFLSDFRYQNVLDYEKGLASAHNQTSTFFLNRNGKVAQKMPVVPGQGTLRFSGSLIQATIDYRIFYLDKKGKIVWRPRKTIVLNNPYRIVEVKYKPNQDYLVYYPVIRGIEDRAIQTRVNDKLKKLSEVKPIGEEKLDYNYYGDFEVEFYKKDLVVLEMIGSQYYFGAAHPMPTKIYSNINLITGKFYKLEDLFLKGSNYVEKISLIVGKQIKEKDIDVFPDAYKGIAADQPFYVNENSLFVYYPPYEIAPYSSGFVTFEIPFREIEDLINKKGEFWRSFH